MDEKGLKEMFNAWEREDAAAISEDDRYWQGADSFLAFLVEKLCKKAEGL